MKSTQHPSNNFVYSPPKGMTPEECTALPVTKVLYPDGTPGIWSYWKPSKEELEHLNTGAFVVLEILGTIQPPVAVVVGR